MGKCRAGMGAALEKSATLYSPHGFSAIQTIRCSSSCSCLAAFLLLEWWQPSNVRQCLLRLPNLIYSLVSVLVCLLLWFVVQSMVQISITCSQSSKQIIHYVGDFCTLRHLSFALLPQVHRAFSSWGFSQFRSSKYWIQYSSQPTSCLQICQFKTWNGTVFILPFND